MNHRVMNETDLSRSDQKQTPPVAPTTTQDKPIRIALVGNPNCGKSALFNLLTGTRQKVANYAGVTVERKLGA